MKMSDSMIKNNIPNNGLAEICAEYKMKIGISVKRCKKCKGIKPYFSDEQLLDDVDSSLVCKCDQAL